jgi:argininosuccinate lyase
MKGLPLAYNRDMQEDKEPLFDAVDTATASLRIMGRMMATVSFDRDRFAEELRNDFLLATELADYLVRKGMPFRKAHGVAGEIVQECAASGMSLRDLPLERYRKFAGEFREDLYGVLDPHASVARKRSAGSTSPKEVEKALRRWEKKLK